MRSFFTKNPTVLIFNLALLFVLSSCEKVLDIKLKDTPSRIVIEANLSDQPELHRVLVSRSVGFNDPNKFPQVSGAQVTLTDDAGLLLTYQEKEPGVYELDNFSGQPGHQYTLTVIADGQTYTAVSTMPAPVAIQNIKAEAFQFDPDTKLAVIEFQEPAGVKNFYRGLYVVNDTLSTDLFFFSDEFNDGRYVEEIFGDEDLQLDPGDAVTIKLQAIDEGIFQFLRGQAQLDNSQSTSPANPVSNFSNGALGYFSAHAQTSASMIVP